MSVSTVCPQVCGYPESLIIYILFRVVEFCVRPNQVDVVKAILHKLIAICLNFLFNSAQIHGVFDNYRVVQQPELLPVDWLSKWCGIKSAVQRQKNLMYFPRFVSPHHTPRGETHASLYFHQINLLNFIREPAYSSYIVLWKIYDKKIRILYHFPFNFLSYTLPFLVGSWLILLFLYGGGISDSSSSLSFSLITL